MRNTNVCVVVNEPGTPPGDGGEPLPFLCAYSLETQYIQPGQDVRFTRLALPSTCRLLGDRRVVITQPGVYYVQYTLMYLGQDGEFALFLNGEQLDGTHFAQHSGGGPISCTALVRAPAPGSILELRNTSPLIANLKTAANCVTAELTLFKLR